MLDLKMIDELTRRLGESLPPGVAQTKEELERRFRAVLTGAFERMNLVSREEFDARCEELAQARAQLESLQQQLDQLRLE
jgi:BMFP domain-containing protein YqiC